MKLLLIFTAISISSVLAVPTNERIHHHGYPVEKHKVQTSDGYILTMFRIPYSPNSPSKPTRRPVAFLQHGFLTSSDGWILSGPGAALPYILSDAGYDVWLGNNRGNKYSRKHIHLTPMVHQFWNFEFHQIALYDVTAMIDYVLFKTNQRSLHFIGHSQGTTVFFIMASVIPQYNTKIKSAHLLSPVAFIDHMEMRAIRAASPFFGGPNGLVELFGSLEIPPSGNVISTFGTDLCRAESITHGLCMDVLLSSIGLSSKCLNLTLIPDITDTHPAGGSINQLLHYVQLFFSKKFQQFDYGMLRNVLVYGQVSPPQYNLENVNAPTFMYYSEIDVFTNPIDFARLTKRLSNVQYILKVPNWNHVDFLWANNVKDILNNKVLENVNKIEKQFME